MQKGGIDSLNSTVVLKGTIHGMIFNVSDSLAFSWDIESSYNKLIICHAYNDSVIMSIPVPDGSSGIILAPGSLNAGTYYWNVADSEAKGHFKVVNE